MDHQSADRDRGFERALAMVERTPLRSALRPGRRNCGLTGDQLRRLARAFWEHGFDYGVTHEEP